MGTFARQSRVRARRIGTVALLGGILRATAASAQTPPPPAPATAPVAAPSPPADVLVHVVSPSPVDLESDAGGNGWRKVCSAPCDRAVPSGAHYRVVGDDVPESTDFSLQPATQSATLTVDPSTKHSRVGGVVLTILGAAGLVPGIAVTSIVVSFTALGAVLVCPILLAANVDYGKCVAFGAVQSVPYYESPYVWAPALGGAGVMTMGVTLLVLTGGGHPTNVTQTPSQASVALPPTALGPWTPSRSSEVSLPPACDVPVVSFTF